MAGVSLASAAILSRRAEQGRPAQNLYLCSSLYLPPHRVNQITHSLFRPLAFLALLFCRITAQATVGVSFTVDGINYKITADDSVKAVIVTGGNPTSETLVIPDYVSYEDTDYAVTSIYSESFWGCTSITSLEIGNNVKEIGIYAFYNCSNLQSAHLSNSVSVIGSSAFQGCNQLKKVVIGSGITKLEDWAFAYCPLEELYINKSTGVTNKGAFYCVFPSRHTNLHVPIGAYSNYKGWFDHVFADLGDNRQSLSVATSAPGSLATQIDRDSILLITDLAVNGEINGTDLFVINKMTNLLTLDLSKATIVAGGNAYYTESSVWGDVNYYTHNDTLSYNCTYGLPTLTSVSLPENLKVVGKEAFKGRLTLQSLDLGNSVTSINDDAFNGCDELQALSIPNSVTSMGKNAFYNANGLLSLVIGTGLSNISESAFYGCSSLTSLYVPDNIINIERNAFRECNLKSATLGNHLKTIGVNAFIGNKNFDAIFFPDSVKSIGKYAFENCVNLASITFGQSVSTIDEYTFNGCNAVTSVYALCKEMPKIKENVFTSTAYKNGTLYVPTGMANIYWLDPVWSKFAHINENDFTGIRAVEEEPFRVENGGVTLAVDGGSYAVYDFMGRVLKRGMSYDGERIMFPKGAAVIEFNGRRIKVMGR